MSVCPNINLQEWKDLEAAHGKFKAYKYFLETGGRILTPEEVTALESQRESYQLQPGRPGSFNNDVMVERLKNLTERIAEKFADSEYRFEHLPAAKWKGKIIKENGKDVVVINTALATADTPLHEFGHIFVAMIRKGNLQLYSKLRSDIRNPRNKEMQAILQEVKENYAGIYTEEGQFEEEAMVELLGRLAAGKLAVDTESNRYVYNLAVQIWEAIVDSLKRLFGPNKDIIDVSYINPSTSMDLLADILANDQVQIKLGEGMREAAVTKNAEKKINELENENRHIRDFIRWDLRDDQGNDKFMPLHDFLTGESMLISKKGIQKLVNFRGGAHTPAGKIGGPLGNIFEYGINDEGFVKDVLSTLDYLKQFKGKDVSDALMKVLETYVQSNKSRSYTLMALNPNPAFNPGRQGGNIDHENLLNELLQSIDYGDPQVFDNYERAIRKRIVDIQNLVKNLKSGYETSPQLFYGDVIKNKYNFKALLNTSITKWTQESQNNWEVEYIRPFDFDYEDIRMPAPPFKGLNFANDRNISAEGLLDKKIEFNNEIINELKANPLAYEDEFGQVRLLQTKKFSLKFYDPYKKKVVDEEVKVVAESYTIAGTKEVMIDNAAFESTIFGYSDAWELQPLKEKKYNQEDLYWEFPVVGFEDYGVKDNFAHVRRGAFRLFNETDEFVELQFSRPSEAYNTPNLDSIYKKGLNEMFGENNWSTRTEQVTFEDYSGQTTSYNTLIIQIPSGMRSKISLVSDASGRATKIMGNVLQSISEIHSSSDNLSVIGFSPVRASITTPKGEIKRAMLYTLYGAKLFGNEYLIKRYSDGALVSLDAVDAEFKALSEEEKADRLQGINYQRRGFSSETIRLKKYDKSVHIWANYVSNKIVVPESFKGRFMSAESGTPLFQLVKNSEKNGLSENPSFAELAEYTQGRSSDHKVTTDQLKNTKAIELANKISDALGVEYEMISEEQAKELTNGTKNPWSGESAFFYNKKVYFVGNGLSTDNVLHEFSHPLVRHMSKTNNAAFQKLFKELEATPEGQEIIAQVKDSYTDLDPESDRYKEEVIVKALTADAMSKLDQEKTKGGFKEFIKNLLFNIKQALRKVFGKSIPVSKISSITTLNELSDILVKGGKIEINTEILTDEDLVAYNREAYENVTQDLQNVKHKDVQSTINTFYDMIQNQLNMLMKNENYEELADILTDEYQRGDLQAMRSNLSQWQTAVANIAAEFEEDVRESRNRVEALANTLFRLESVMEKVFEHIEDISKQPDTQDNMHKAYYYDKFIKYWSEFMSDFKDVLDDPANNVPDRSPIVSLEADISRNLRRSKNIINDMYAKGARDTVYEQMEPINRTLRNRYEKILADMKERGAPQERIDTIYREYHGMSEAEYREMNRLLQQDKKSGISVSERKKLDKLLSLSQNGLSISKDKIEALLKGNMGDANWYNSYLEGYLYNTDPVIGGMALYTKNATNEMIVNGQNKANKFFETMRPLLIKAGYNPQKIGELGEKIGFRDKVAKWNRETGEFEEREVYTLLNKFKNYRYDQDRLAREVDMAQRNYATSNLEEDRQVWLDAIAAQKKFERDYMHQEFTKEFYDRYELLEQDEIGKEAAYRRENFFEELRKLTEPAKTQSDNLFIADEVDDLWRDYRQMHSRYDLNGKPKTGREAEIAKRLRSFKNKSRDFYEWKMRRGVFENAYKDFLEELRYEGVEEGSATWLMRIDEWKKRNSRKVIKDEWYERRNEILDNIKAILSKLPKSERAAIDQSAIWEEIIELASGFRDDDNQIIGTDLSEGSIQRIQELQRRLEKMKEDEIKTNGLSQRETDRMYELINKRKVNKRLDRAEFDELQDLFNKKNTYGLSKADAEDLAAYYEELSEMTERDATVYYVDILNNWLSKLNTDVMDAQLKTRTVTATSAHIIFDEKILNSLLGQDAEFDAWFKNNHIQKGRNKEWARMYVWNVIKPADPNMMESYEIKDATGKVIDTIEGLPSLDYYARVVKTKYRTRKVIGETVDNRGRFLPMTVEDGALDSKYINEDYERMRTEDPNLFAVLEKMKEFHLSHQEGLSYKSRLYLDFPRFVKSGLEVWQSTTVDEYGKKKWNALSQFIQRIKDWLYGDKARAEDGFNYEDDFNLVRADMFDNEITDVPIAGLYDVDADDVSMDIGQNMLRYMLSAERQKQLVRISPVVRAIQSSLKSNNVVDLDRVNEAEFKNRGILRYLEKKDNVRLAAVNNFIQREFEGQKQASAAANVPWLNNFANFMFKRASFSFFALNIPSALKNSLGMKFQSMIEASGGQFVDHVSLQKGNGWAYKAMGELSFNGDLYNVRAKSHNLQLVEIFDPIQDRFTDRMGENMSRTMLKDATEFSWLYSPRKWVETQASLQLFGGMMYKKKIMMGDKEIAYMDAFETVDNQVRLKEGIDVRYGTSPVVHLVKEGDTVESLAKQYNIPLEEAEGIFTNLEERLASQKLIEEDRALALEDVPDLNTIEDEYERLKVQDKIDAINKKYDKRLEKKGSITIRNSEFNYMKNQVQQVMNNMGGAYAKFDQPEAQRYLFFRFISYLRRYFTTMFINRWGFSGPYNDPKPRLNPGLGDVQMGFYVQFGKTLIETIKQGGSNLKYLTDAEKTAALKFFSEVVMLLGTTALMSLLFGWDPDDDERYAKLREKSGALPFPLTADDPERDFELFGYMEVHALHMLMQVRGENEQFNLLTGALKHYNSLLDIKSVAFGPTTDSYVQLWEDTKAMATGDDSAWYSRDVGPYLWQQQGGSKFMTHLAKTFGLTGSSLDGAQAIQNFQTYQAKVRT